MGASGRGRPGLTNAGYHGNNQIEMNITLGYTRVTTLTVPAYGCASQCHFSAQLNTAHNLENSGWALNPLAGPALSCNACHGAGTGEYWPVAVGATRTARASTSSTSTPSTRQRGTLVGTTATDKKNQTCSWWPPGDGDHGARPEHGGVAGQTADSTSTGSRRREGATTATSSGPPTG